MANSNHGGGVLGIFAMILVLLTRCMAAAEGMTVTLGDGMTQAISISCHSTSTSLDTQLVSPGRSFVISVIGGIGNFTSGLKYACTFVTPGKPTTTIDVFVGWGGVKNLPCKCLGSTCPWQITATGLSCNSGA